MNILIAYERMLDMIVLYIIATDRTSYSYVSILKLSRGSDATIGARWARAFSLQVFHAKRVYSAHSDTVSYHTLACHNWMTHYGEQPRPDVIVSWTGGYAATAEGARVRSMYRCSFI